MDFIDKKNVSLVKIGQKPSKISRFVQNRPGGYTNVYIQLICQNVCKGSFPQSRWSVEQRMIQCFTAQIGRFYKNPKIVQRLVLPGKILKTEGAERFFHIKFLRGKVFTGRIQMFVHVTKIAIVR